MEASIIKKIEEITSKYLTYDFFLANTLKDKENLSFYFSIGTKAQGTINWKFLLFEGEDSEFMFIKFERDLIKFLHI